MNFSIIPKPKFLQQNDGFFNFENDISLTGELSVKIQNEVNRIFNIQQHSTKTINFFINTDILAEGYSLVIEKTKIDISAASDCGFFYALQTLRQVICQFSFNLPCLKILDSPKLSFRGYMMDVGRYFFKIEDIKKQIDYISLYKINYLHLHLTEDQGWRVEIKKYPLLTTIGAFRERTLFNHSPHGGFYTQAELRDLVAYADERFVTIIPEVDIPGHTQSALASYSFLSCFDRTDLKVATKFGIKHDILCAGKDTTYTFVKDVLTEIAEIFHGYIHIGGDEVAKTRWKMCAQCQKLMAEKGLKTEEDLQIYFIKEITDFLLSRGITPIMWSLGKGGEILDKRVIQQYWSSAAGADRGIIEMINDGRQCINSNSGAYYIDIPHGINSLEKLYKTPAIFDGVTKPENVLGIELPLWSEYVKNQKIAEKLTFPRLLAGAEVAYSENLNYDDFLSRVRLNEKMLNQLNIEFTSLKNANPKFLVALAGKFKWWRRWMHWEGLGNLINNHKAKIIAQNKTFGIKKQMK
ncbi:MAG: beta-N-acetylhexosaminidase [Clostridia bacterium]